ncbi:hypothetical protein [Desulfosporosinus nitroreducens]|uniref:Uncharacterized protein n=1 Tax=Desulfosporosinus nitroreducens TaxID=2018668 RepID=A0ABT8QPQ4_9FIRM|nr:hypothetical protein [Desulfosporosinus nitroreducens]MDO0823265.1 hypothetical protein [Desulfosporosinus nitroreducens]
MKKKFLIFTGAMLLFIALICFWGYNKYFKPNPQIQQQLNSQFGAEFFTSFNDANVAKTLEDADTVEGANSLGTSNNLQLNNEPKSVEYEESEVLNNSTSANENIEKRITENQISAKYKPQFNNLQNIALSRLDTLYSAAIQEYSQRSKAGTLNRSELIQKYMQAATMLEANVDSQFYSTLSGMQGELIANHLSVDIIDMTKSQYEKAKSDKRSQLLSKVGK